MSDYKLCLENDFNNNGFSIIDLDDLKNESYKNNIYDDMSIYDILTEKELLLLSDSELLEIIANHEKSKLYNLDLIDEDDNEYRDDDDEDDEIEELNFNDYNFKNYIEDYRLYFNYDDWVDENY